MKKIGKWYYEWTREPAHHHLDLAPVDYSAGIAGGGKGGSICAAVHTDKATAAAEEENVRPIDHRGNRKKKHIVCVISCSNKGGSGGGVEGRISEEELVRETGSIHTAIR